jgi:hypothetical protein
MKKKAVLIVIVRVQYKSSLKWIYVEEVKFLKYFE